MEDSQKFDAPILTMNGAVRDRDDGAKLVVPVPDVAGSALPLSLDDAGDEVSKWAAEDSLSSFGRGLSGIVGWLLAVLLAALAVLPWFRRRREGGRESRQEAGWRREAERWRQMAGRLQADLDEERRRLHSARLEWELERRKLQAESQAARYEVQLLADVHERDRKRVEAELSGFTRQIAENISRRQEQG